MFKKGSRSEVSNYQPISLISVCCKVMDNWLEMLLWNTWSFSNGFLSESQYGFVHGRSCTTQLLKVIDKWTQIIDGGWAVECGCSVCLDFAKAFDTVLHERLLVKLASYGIQEQAERAKTESRCCWVILFLDRVAEWCPSGLGSGTSSFYLLHQWYAGTSSIIHLYVCRWHQKCFGV